MCALIASGLHDEPFVVFVLTQSFQLIWARSQSITKLFVKVIRQVLVMLWIRRRLNIWLGLVLVPDRIS